jgi:ubiquinone/menaquinone biosynthesis C-methylase UbiE
LNNKGTSRARKPKYGLYAIKIIVILFSVIEIIGLLLLSVGCFVFNNTYLIIGGVIVVAFGIYMIVAHFLSLYVFTGVGTARSVLDAKHMELKGNEYVLDVGTGTGRTAIQVAKRLTTGKLVGIDICDTMELGGNSPERAYENAEIEGVKEKVEFKFGNVLEIPFDDNVFDIVTCSSVLNNLPGEKKRIKALKEILRVLKPKGNCMLLEPLRNFRMFCAFTPFAFFQLGKKEHWEKYSRIAGFSEVKFHSEKGIGVFVLGKQANDANGLPALQCKA